MPELTLDAFEAEIAESLDAEAGRREDIAGDESSDWRAPRRRANHATFELLHRPEVAEKFIRGVPDLEIARELGVSVSAVRRVRTQSPRMADLLAAESSRIVAHLSTRNLGEEKYLGLATALGVMIEKERLIRGEATSRSEVYGSGTAESLTVALFGIPRLRPREIAEGPSDSPGEHRSDSHDEPGSAPEILREPAP